MANMRERSRTKSENGRAHIHVGDYLDAEDVCKAGATIGAEGAEDEVFTLLIEYKDPRNHGEWMVSGRQEKKWRG